MSLKKDASLDQSEQTTLDPSDFSNLSPEFVLDAVCAAGYACDGRMLALNSYENRVYQLGLDDGLPVIAKFYRPQRWSDQQILEEHTFVEELLAQEIPVVPALQNPSTGSTLQHFCGYRFAVFARQGGRAPELDRADTLEWLGRFIGRIHAVGAAKSYVHRPAIDADSFGWDSLDYLTHHDFLPADIAHAYTSTAKLMLQGVESCYARAGQSQIIRLHGDCHLGNVLWSDHGVQRGPYFLDFDDSRAGPAIQDLWMLLSGSLHEMQNQLIDILTGYEDFLDFDTKQLHLIEALRSLRLLHYSAWLAQRWNDPAFKVAFPWFNTQKYWQDRILEMREQIALMEESPLSV